MLPRPKLAAILFIAVVASVAVGFSAFLSLQQLLDANRWVTHTHIVIEKLQEVLSLHKDAETGQRGYILTGENEFLEPYTAAIKLTQSDIDSLRDLTSDNPAQQKSIVTLQAMSDAKLTDLHDTIELRRKSGLDAALAVVRTQHGKKLMDDLQALIVQMQNRELVLLQRRNETASNSAKRAITVLAVWPPLLAMLALLFTQMPRAPGLASPTAMRRGAGRTLLRYASAVTAVAVAGLICWSMQRAFGRIQPFIFFFPAVLIVASIAGAGPGIVATVLAAVTATFFFLPPIRSFWIDSPNDILSVAIFTGTNVFTCILADRLQRARSLQRLTQQQELMAVTLASIGDGVIVADTSGRIVFLNAEAERLTGWALNEALGLPLAEVFNVINEETRLPLENPVDQAERSRRVVGLPPHTLLVTKDRREIFIDDSSAPVRQTNSQIQATVVVFRDFTRRRQAEAMQQSQRLLLETVVEHLPAAMNIIRGSDMTLQLVNPAYQAIAPDVEMIGKTLEQLWPEAAKNFDQLCRKVLETGEPYHAVDEPSTIRRSPDGPPETGYFSWSMFRVRLPGDDGYGILNTAWETTASKKAEIAVRESELRFRTMLNAIPQLAWTARADGFLDWYNQRWYEYTGTVAGDMAGWGWKSVHDPATLPLVMQRWTECIASGQPFEMIFPLRRHDGQFRSFLTRVQPLRNEQGQVVQWFGTNTDIEELKQAEETQARLAAIVESSDDAILSKRLDGTILTWNAAAERLFGYRAQEIVGKPIYLLIPPELVAEEAQIVERLRRGEQCEHIETVRVAKDGSRIDVSLTISPLKDSAGNVVGASKIARDISERKRAQEALSATMQAMEHARSLAEAANTTKDHFIAVLSHELRTPLNPVLAASAMLLADPRFDAQTREQLSMICRNVEVEAKLIDDLLDATRIQRGKVELAREPSQVSELLGRVVEAVAPECAAKNVRLDVDPSLEQYWILGDPARLRQIYSNIIKNAIKFSSPGGSVTVRGTAENAGLVLVEVIDQGAGIEPDAIGRIFNPFEQADRSITRRFGGLGLGLAIAKAMVELHGGTITAMSDGIGKGSTFQIRLPLTASPVVPFAVPNLPPMVAPLEPRRMRLLLVEDHIDTARIMKQLLKKKGHEVEHASNVASAMSSLAQHQYDLLLSDIGLPDGNGLDIMRELRRQGSKLPGIALSGHGQESDIQNSLSVGFSIHLTKPVDVLVLFEKIQEIGNQPPHQTAA